MSSSTLLGSSPSWVFGAGNAVRTRVHARLAVLGTSPESALLAGFLIGDTTDTHRMELYFGEDKVADMPIAALTNDAPEYDRPWVESAKEAKLDSATLEAPDDLLESLAGAGTVSGVEGPVLGLVVSNCAQCSH